MAESDPFIDRTEEQDLFDTILSLVDDARVLTISDGTGRGKSRLLKQLRLKCQVGARQAPVCLVTLDEMEQKTAYSFVEIAEAALGATGLTFPEFKEVQDRRLQASLGGGNVGEANVTNNPGVAAGVYLEKGAHATFFGNRIPTDLEERMRREAVGAFLQDLETHCGQQPVVILLDAYEHVGGELEVFLTGFLQTCVANPDRYHNLIVVIAGQHVPTNTLRLMFDARYDNVVKSVDALSTWGRPHVKDFLDAWHRAHDDADIEYLSTRMAGGWTIEQAKHMVKIHLQGN